MFLIGSLWFSVWSVAAALAPSAPTFIVFLGMLGIGVGKYSRIFPERTAYVLTIVYASRNHTRWNQHPFISLPSRSRERTSIRVTRRRSAHRLYSWPDSRWYPQRLQRVLENDFLA